MEHSSPVGLALDRGPVSSFTRLAARYLREYREKIELTVSRLDEEQLWWRPAPGTNSIGNLLLHLEGNLSLWLLSGVGGLPYERNRRGEFEAERSADKDELLGRLRVVVDRGIEILDELGDATLSSRIDVQGYETNILGAIFHATEHTSYHTGQILHLVKAQLEDEGALELYPQHRNE